MRGGRLDHADAAAILGDGPGQRQIGVDQHLGAAGRWFKPKRCDGIGTAAALQIGPLRFYPGAVAGVVELLEGDEACKRKRDRAKPDRDPSSVGPVIDDFRELGTRHAGRYALDIHQEGPSLRRRQRHFE